MITNSTENQLAQLDEPYALPSEAITFYRENGYVKLKNVLSPDLLAYYGDLITEWVFKLNTLTKPMEERTTYERAFLQVMNLWLENDAIKTFVFSRRLARIAAELMGVEGVRLYHDQALYKEPSGGITPWHADQYYWPLSSDKTITVWIPLQDTPYEMGPLAFAERSQTVNIGRDLKISDESEQQIAEALKTFTVNETPFELGEVSFHAGWTFHRAGANSSSQARRVMTMIYMDKDIQVTEPDNDNRIADWKTWLQGKAVGTTADSALNPILYDVR
ncbi:MULTISPECIES: phytanoyl-CoA dioxygenase family protein [unclassified Spirosoma]|uniref:phytanoyl-CoA dioxygenase family protein n=1 Tax=unclassified Spirosoma TaxID=2621999 RepID=UPI000963275B|nr:MULTISPECIES: phytanoyl-CoA dioxygenase family protein [unclassified Spirosoma]MBN8821929.1 phytanoyl-CoA dioxygenase family protein [Spirosoma sp.]OJW80593.1 MAG: phytanoyl-CoA dioxygenase [Spirosoma sp. 48-14]